MSKSVFEKLAKLKYANLSRGYLQADTMIIERFDNHEAPNFGKSILPTRTFPRSQRLRPALPSWAWSFTLWLSPKDFEDLPRLDMCSQLEYQEFRSLLFQPWMPRHNGLCNLLLVNYTFQKMESIKDIRGSNFLLSVWKPELLVLMRVCCGAVYCKGA